MGVLITLGTVIFVILCVLLIILILLQSDKSAGMGLLGGSSQSAFGSSTADVITKATAVMIGLFMIGSLGLSIMEARRVSTLEKSILKNEPQRKGDVSSDAEKKEAPASEKGTGK